MKQKYINLLLNKCLNFNNPKSLFICYPKENKNFVLDLVEVAKNMGINDIYLEEEDINERHEILSKISLEDIDLHPYFNKKMWDEYALKNASFLILEGEFPHVLDDIDSAKISRAGYIERTTKPVYKKMQLSYIIPWCIAEVPNRIWAKELFPELSSEDAYEKLSSLIYIMSMANTSNPIESWNRVISNQLLISYKLNTLDITNMYYKNSIGTDLEIELSKNAIWESAANDKNMIVNMPSYEIFTNPNFRKTNGVVFSSRPLMSSGGLIDDFYIEFKDGKAVKYNAKKGNNLLDEIIKSDEYSGYLGEVALIDKDTPISKTGLIFQTTLLDENASCHLALGNGFPSCIKNSMNMSDEELLEFGVNPSKNHVDFMIGTTDLNIVADTNKGKKLIFKKGKFNL